MKPLRPFSLAPFSSSAMASAGEAPDASAARTVSNTGGAVGDNVGTLQGPATARPTTAFTTSTAGDHRHGLPNVEVDTWFSSGGSSDAMDDETPASIQKYTDYAGDHTHSISGGGDAETRPRNAAVKFCIKF